MKSTTLTILLLLIFIGNGNAQNENWLKIDISRGLFYSDIAVDFETRKVKTGWQYQLVYRNDVRTIQDFSFSIDPTIPLPPLFEFKQKKFEVSLSHLWYFNRKNKTYVGLISTGQFNLSFDQESYDSKYLEVFGKASSFNPSANRFYFGPIIGTNFYISPKFRIELGFKIAIDMVALFANDGILDLNSNDGSLPLKLGFKF